MAYADYDLDNIKLENREELERSVFRAFTAEGDLTDDSSEKFSLLAELFRTFFNRIAVEILIKRLKIEEKTAREIHKSAWENLEIEDYNPAKNTFLKDYLASIASLAGRHIKESADRMRNAGKRLENYVFENVFAEKNEDKLVSIKERWAYVWSFVADADEIERTIFLYKLYAKLDFTEISRIVGMSEVETRDIYLEVEDRLFSDEKFKKNFP